MDVDGGMSLVFSSPPYVRPTRLIATVSTRPSLALADEPSKPKGAWVALVSGLEVSGEDEKTVDLKMTLLVEWLMGELGSEAVRPLILLSSCCCMRPRADGIIKRLYTMQDQELAGSVCRLIIAGNSLLTTIRPVDPTKSVSTFSLFVNPIVYA
jgi:hypothetical protein